MYIKRTVVLSKLGDENTKIMANIEDKGDNPIINVKCNDEKCDLFVVARFEDSPLELIQLKEMSDNTYLGELPQYFDCSQKIYLELMEIETNKLHPMFLGGLGAGKQNFHNEVIKNLSYFFKKCKMLKGVISEEKEVCDDTGLIMVENDKSKLFESPSEDEIDDIITNELLAECMVDDNKCENCIYKNSFYANSSKNSISTAKNSDNSLNKAVNMAENQEKHTNKDVDSNDSVQFYNQINKSLSSLFDYYPSDEALENAIDGGKFVKIDYENTGDYYSVGYIKDGDDVPKYICYAIPCSPGSPPPRQMEEFSQYLSIDENLAYYLMYQNASDGKTIQIEND